MLLKQAQEEKFSQLERNDKKNFIFKLVKIMKNENQAIVCDKCMKNDEGCLAYDDFAKLKTWKSHYKIAFVDLEKALIVYPGRFSGGLWGEFELRNGQYL